MIGVFDSGIGGLTVLRALVARFPDLSFHYLADHAHAPYGNRPAEEIVALVRRAVDHLFHSGCQLVLLGCNTATAVAARRLQREWLPASTWRQHNVLGIVAPTVEAATQTPWSVTEPQYPQKYNTDVIAVFGTTRTITSHVYIEEIRKRCPRVRVVQQACPDLAGAIEHDAPAAEIERLVKEAARDLLAATGATPHKAILGCTHFPLVEDLFRKSLPESCRILSQPEVVADSLDDYLERKPWFMSPSSGRRVTLMTTGDPAGIARTARVFWPDAPAFERVAVAAT
jgi:glutamate racemase